MTFLLNKSSRSNWLIVLMLAAFFAHAGAPIDTERASELKVTAIGTRLAGTTQIPAFSVDVRTGLDLGPDDRALAKLPVLPRGIKAKSLSWVHLTGYGWLVIPAGWRVVDGGVGADGSMVLMAQSKSGASWLEYSDAGNCVGCAISQASCFYPQAYVSALENEFLFDACDNAKVTTSGAKPIASLQNELQKTKDGAIQSLRNYIDQDGVRYQQLQVHQPDLSNANGEERINLKSDALGVFFARVWIAEQ